MKRIIYFRTSSNHNSYLLIRTWEVIFFSDLGWSFEESNFLLSKNPSHLIPGLRIALWKLPLSQLSWMKVCRPRIGWLSLGLARLVKGNIRSDLGLWFYYPLFCGRELETPNGDYFFSFFLCFFFSPLTFLEEIGHCFNV